MRPLPLGCCACAARRITGYATTPGRTAKHSASDTLSCKLLDPTTRRALWHKEVCNTLAGHKHLLRQTHAETPWGLEPTGRYFQEVARAAHEAGRDMRLAQPKEAELRRLLFLAAQASLRAKNSPFKAQYERERAKGLSSTAAVCAVARKMARLAWSRVTHGSAYEPERIYQQPKQQPSDS